MAIWLVVFFLAPIVEMYLLMRVGEQIGALPTVALVVVMAALGVALVWRQGVSPLTRGVARLRSGEVPAQEMLEGLLVALAGVLLIVPGFVTDVAGLLLMLPPLRAATAGALLTRAVSRAEVVIEPARYGGRYSGQSGPGGPARPRPQRDDFLVIEGEYEERSESTSPPRNDAPPGS